MTPQIKLSSFFKFDNQTRYGIAYVVLINVKLS